jgi:hypothetical protein
VAWVRWVRTASGSTAVQIAESVAGRRRIVRHVGSARDETELGLLMAEAHRLLEDNRQGVLDLGITPQARQAAMVPAPGAAGTVRRRAGTGCAAGGAAGADAEDGVGPAV